MNFSALNFNLVQILRGIHFLKNQLSFHFSPKNWALLEKTFGAIFSCFIVR